MHLARAKDKSPALPLQDAVLCVNCECVSSGRFDACPVCGGKALLNIGQMLGGTPLPDLEIAANDSDLVLFDITLTIELKRMNPRDVNAALDRITRLIGPRLAQRRARFHVNVQPVARDRSKSDRKAA